jgi:hypothetical protein
LHTQDENSLKFQPIDAVITWVDGNDPALRAKRRQFLGSDGKGDKNAKERFSEVGELYYCIALILKNAQFINRIFIVTDNQYPPYIDKIREQFGDAAFDKLKVVDHSEIFQGFESHLPVFNSVSIETLLHRIPGLSNRYIYFNDDVFIARKVLETDFFQGERPILRGCFRSAGTATHYQRQRERRKRGKLSLIQKNFSYKETQYLSFVMLGIHDRYFWHDHTPHPFSRHTIEELEREYFSEFLKNISHRERHNTQWDIMAAAAGMEIGNGNSNFQDPSLTVMKPSSKKLQAAYVLRKKASSALKKTKFLCIQSLSMSSPNAQRLCKDWLADLIDNNGNA